MKPVVATPDPITALGAIELSAAIHRRDVSCVEVMQAYLQRIHNVNPVFNAIVALRAPEPLIEEAKGKDVLLAKGRAQGFLHGIPQAIKDLAPAQGLHFTRGSPLFKDHIAAEDALIVARAKAAGAIVIGKTNTPEFGFGSHTYNPVYGITRNAYDTDMTAGGSSGGAAVALAHHLLPVADGSDMGGSLRNPAAYNNVVGFRPSQGRVPMWPNLDTWFGQMGVEGPMARNVADLAQLLAIQSGWDVRVPLSLEGDGAMFAQALTPLSMPSGRKIRIGWLGDWEGVLPYEPGILQLCEKALHRLGAEHIEIVPLRFGFDTDRLWSSWVSLRSAAIAANLGDLYQKESKREQLKPEAQWEIEQGLRLSAVELHQASMIRTQWYARYLQMFEQVDFIAAPTAQVWPWPVEITWPRSISGRAMDTYHRWMQGVSPWTMAGAPVLNIPVGFSDAVQARAGESLQALGTPLPMGMQLVGPPRADWSVLRLGCLAEQVLRV
jgi:amidase